MKRAPIDSFFRAHWSRMAAEWAELLRFPSISALPEHARDCRACAAWLSGHLRNIGFESRLIPTAAHPLVYGCRRGQPGKPVILFYGHYDVQPVDPREAWTTPPFEPAWRGARLYARGAQDNKGQILYALKAMEALIRNGDLVVTVKVILEGDEENGRSQMARLGKTARRLLRADVLLSCDALKAVPGIPTITLGLRGLVTLTAVLRGPRRDLHSGVHGGKAPNPALGLARLLASLHHPDGSVAVPGFYDGVAAPTAEERSLINAVPFSAAQYKRLTGVEAVGGEHGYTPAERAGLRPALDVNGLSGGYADAGCKTIIPASATAKLSARLVAGQHLRRCLERIVRHLERHTPRGLRLDISERHVAGPAVRLRLDSPWVRLARDILRQVTGRAPLLHWEGASIPVMAQLPALAGAELLLVGFGEERDNIHAPNESFSRAQFRQGYRFVARFLQAAGGG